MTAVVDEEWHYEVGGEKFGPVSAAELTELMRGGKVSRQDLVWKSTMNRWLAAGDLAVFSRAFVGVQPAAIAPGNVAMPAVYQSYGAYAQQFPYAAFETRFFAAVIDGIITSVIVLIASLGIAYMAATAAPTPGHGKAPDWLLNVLRLISFAVGWLYGAGMESSAFQATVGKMLMGIRVTDLTGERVSFGTATIRHFSKWISAIILLIGYFMAAWTEKKQALHDMMAGTLVVRG